MMEAGREQCNTWYEEWLSARIKSEPLKLKK